MHVLLDTGLLGRITNPAASVENEACRQWIVALLLHGHSVYVPEIADYELRCELLRTNRRTGLERLDELCGTIEYLPLNTAAMRQAALFWAQARQQGRPTADRAALDADAILAGQAAGLMRNGLAVVVATTNVRHLARFVPARRWQDIQPG